MKCDANSRDASDKDRVAINAVRDFVRSHQPGVEATPSIVETCIHTVINSSCRSYVSTYLMITNYRRPISNNGPLNPLDLDGGEGAVGGCEADSFSD